MEKSEIHGDPLGTNKEGLYRFILENWNDLAPWKTKNQNILMVKKFAQRLETDGCAVT